MMAGLERMRHLMLSRKLQRTRPNGAVDRRWSVVEYSV